MIERVSDEPRVVVATDRDGKIELAYNTCSFGNGTMNLPP
ncbi:hypothetical protein EMGBD1_23920 [Anaerolineaceae bacterium]|nr:hypothetical protein EMGBD1_23920 [Anaerolineaceae bacterium]